jgi:hypothetical protein
MSSRSTYGQSFSSKFVCPIFSRNTVPTVKKSSKTAVISERQCMCRNPSRLLLVAIHHIKLGLSYLKGEGTPRRLPSQRDVSSELFISIRFLIRVPNINAASST